MLEYTGAGAGARPKMLLLHDDAAREYAYGPAQGLPDTRVGTFTRGLFDEARTKGWTVISMKQDWKRVFAFEKRRLFFFHQVGCRQPRHRRGARGDQGGGAVLA
jgi:hypothetical protein